MVEMEKIAYCILLYGVPYFRDAVEAIYPQVDKIYIFYASGPSQGFQTALTNPDTEKELKDSVAPFMDKIEWVTGDWKYEGEHTEAINQFTKGYDWKIRFDSDEIYPPGAVDYFIKQMKERNCQEGRLPFLHFWRSFNRVCRDAQHPIRIYNLTGGNGFCFLEADDRYRVYHMGYAMPTKYIEYKMQVQAHKPEWRPEWFTEIWLKNAQENIHPVSFLPTPLWNAEEFPLDKLPIILKKHPYYGKKKIE